MSQQDKTPIPSLKSSLDPTVSNVLDTPEEQPAEDSPDYEADPTDTDIIDPDLINHSIRKTDELKKNDHKPDSDDENSNLISPDFDLPTPDDVIR